MGVQSSFGFTLGRMEKGKLNKITDVPGVRVGHVTRHEGGINTGVTAILPHTGDMFHDKCPAASHVINGFGKSIGLVQVNELGTIETPLLLTNTLSVGTAATALVKYMLERNADIGCDTGTVNPMVFECNDGHLNDIRGLHVTEQNALDALANAADDFEEGAVGAGSGMSCYSLKGGIGSASRVFELYGNKYTVGALLLTNFGTLRDLTIGGERVGERLYQKKEAEKAAAEQQDKGSVIIIIATDAPVSARQLQRVARRAQSGIARTGSISGNGSGEIALAFTTANRIPHYSPKKPIAANVLFEDDMDLMFRAAIECVEESVISSLTHAEHTKGFRGHEKECLAELL